MNITHFLFPLLVFVFSVQLSIATADNTECSFDQCRLDDGSCVEIGTTTSRFCFCVAGKQGAFIACTGALLPETEQCTVNQCRQNDGSCVDIGTKTSRFCSCVAGNQGAFIACTGLLPRPDDKRSSECAANQCEIYDGTCLNIGEKSGFCSCFMNRGKPFLGCTGLVLPDDMKRSSETTCSQNQCRQNDGSCVEIGTKTSRFCSCVAGNQGAFIACTGLLPRPEDKRSSECAANQCARYDGTCLNIGEKSGFCSCFMNRGKPFLGCTGLVLPDDMKRLSESICSPNQCRQNDGSCVEIGTKTSRFCSCVAGNQGAFIACTGLLPIPEDKRSSECTENQCRLSDGTCAEIGEKTSKFCMCAVRRDGPFIACTGLIVPPS